jgi:hypothetical protein
LPISLFHFLKTISSGGLDSILRGGRAAPPPDSLEQLNHPQLPASPPDSAKAEGIDGSCPIPESLRSCGNAKNLLT